MRVLLRVIVTVPIAVLAMIAFAIVLALEAWHGRAPRSESGRPNPFGRGEWIGTPPTEP
jgi:hypothetical protein